MPNFPDKPCRECQSAFQPRHPSQEYCSTNCGRIFNNRRAVRGAELYDLFCALRSERKLSGEIGIWTEMCRLELRWKEEDGQVRKYLPPRLALNRLYETGRLMMGEIVAKAHRIGRG